MMLPKSTFKPIDTAFAILFVLLIVVSALHVTRAADVRERYSPAVLQVSADLERFRSLEQQLSFSLECLMDESLDRSVRIAILKSELGRIEKALEDLGRSAPSAAGLTRLVEPHMHIVEATTQLDMQATNIDTISAPNGMLDRALRAAQFVARNNIARLGEEQVAVAASLTELGDRSMSTALGIGFLAILIFAPVRLMAGRAAAKPLQRLHAATTALAEERWNPTSVQIESKDAVGELVLAFHTMASKLQNSRADRARTFQCTLASLVHTIEAKDPYVSNHSSNVAKISYELACAMGLSEKSAGEIADGALVHDIGKICVPDAIMHKPGKLTEEEFDIVKTHTVIGDRIISPLDGSEVLQSPVRHHHEYWDGSGYPDGLIGEKIPLVARIVQIADIFEALTSDRSYRSKMTVDEAVGIIQSQSGTKLDPELVSKFMSRVLPKIHEILPELGENATAGETHLDGDTADQNVEPVAAR
ncbi:MAG: HD domain-containing protein [Planctomycetes bacterium]|nr:HD domain-containing protein [Planctomycetota bacterium]